MNQQPLPDFTQAGVYFGQASNELQQQFQLMNNVPNVQLQQIINQLNRLTDNFNQRMDRLERRFDGLETKFEHQSVFEHNNVKVYDVNINSNQNSMARLQNHHASSPTDALTPLVNLATGQDIPNFPADSNSITRLTGESTHIF